MREEITRYRLLVVIKKNVTLKQEKLFAKVSMARL